MSVLCASAVFGALVTLEPSDSLGWAFILTTVSGVLFLVNGILLATTTGRDGCTTMAVTLSKRTMHKTDISTEMS